MGQNPTDAELTPNGVWLRGEDDLEFVTRTELGDTLTERLPEK